MDTISRAFTGRPTRFPGEAVTVLDDVRRAMERNSLESARTAAARLLSLLACPEPAPSRGGLAPWQQRKIDRYLKDHLDQPLQLEELAAQLPLSVSHFCRAFKETFGATPHVYLTRLRLDRAQATMLATTDPLSQIALDSGFADQSHLSRVFSRVVGQTPSAWRRRNLTEAHVDASRRTGCRAQAA
jgi:AraC-like DNA-binding protein